MSRAPRAALALVATALLLQACAHVPLGTMWAMRHFSPRDLTAIEPTGLRAAVNLPDAWRLQPGGHLLEADLAIDGGAELKARVPMEVEVSLREAKDLEAVADAHWHVLKIAPEGIAEFQRLQAFIVGIPEGGHGSFELNVVPKMDPSPETRARYEESGKFGKLSVALKLAPELEWLTLVDGFPLDNTAPGDGAKP